MHPPPRQSEWPTQVDEAPTRVYEDAAPPGAPVPPPVDPRRRAHDELWPWLFVPLVLVIAGLVALWWFGLRDRSSQHAATTPVTQPTFPATTIKTPVAKIATPKLIGLTEAEAAAKLARVGLREKATPVKSLAPAGTVTAQKPVAGTHVTKGSQVLLSVAQGKPAVGVPDVRGQPAPAAVAALRKAGILTIVVGVPSTQPKGTVVAEAPAAGAKAPAGAKVRLNISTGTQTKAGTTAATPTATATATTQPAPRPAPNALKIPNVVSLPQSPAVGTLERAGLPAQVTLVQSSQPVGRVVSQQPAAQANATRGQVVQLNVSLGSSAAQPVEVPDVTGQDVQQATQTLQQAGFVVETVYRKVSAAGQDGKVVDEQPAGQAPQGWKITLVVGRMS
jgi:beta-lactam-binding protein with PASTA domain